MKELFKYLFLGIFFSLCVLNGSKVFAAYPGGDWNDILKSVAQYDPSGGRSEVNSLIDPLIKIVSGAVYTIAFIMLIVTGIKFISSKGNPKLLEEARRSLTWTIVSLFLSVLAFTIRAIILDTVL